MTIEYTFGHVVAVCRNPEPGLPKPQVDAIHLLAGLGVEGDYHAGKLVRHRYLARKYPNRANNRQVLLVDASTFAELAQQGIEIGPGMMGENITVASVAGVAGVGVMQLSEGTQLAAGSAVLEITEIRKPCVQLNEIDERLLKGVVTRKQGKKMFKSGIMARVLQEGWVRAGDKIQVVAQPELAETSST